MQIKKISNRRFLKINRLERLGLNLVLYSKLFGTTVIGLGMVSLLAVARKDIKFNSRELLFLVIVLIQLALSLLLSGSLSALSNTLFYYSFIPVYFLLRGKGEDELIKLLKYLIYAMFLFTLIEFLILNSSLGNYIWYFGEDHTHRALIIGIQRAQGLSAISSSSGVISVLCLALYSIDSKINILKFRVIAFTTIVLLMSGSGFFLLLAYVLLLIFTNSIGVHRRLISFGILIIMAIALLLFFENIGVNKFTLTYFVEIYEFKFRQYHNEITNSGFVEVMLGSQAHSQNSSILTSTDFAIMGLYQGMGIVSTILLVATPILIIGYVSRYRLILILCVVSWLHYPALPSPAGAIFFGIFLALYRSSYRKILSAENKSQCNLARWSIKI
jgi:hypothetical protein